MTRRHAAASWGEARAKANLGLAVTGRRADGLHTLDSVFLRLALHDHLEATFATDAAGPDELEVVGDTGVPAAADLVVRAAVGLRDALRDAIGRPLPALRFRLEKDIPVAAGLAGGSADAAAALELAARMWGLDPDDERIAAVAETLGADVPFCRSRAAAARVTGIGEQVAALPAPTSPVGVVLVTPPLALSTRDVFAAFDALGAVGRRDPHEAAPSAAQGGVARLAAALAAGASAARVADLAAALRDANDLGPAATSLLPELPRLRDVLERSLGRPVLMTGSGPTLLALYPSPEDAALAAAGLRDACPREAEGARIIASASVASGGAP